MDRKNVRAGILAGIGAALVAALAVAGAIWLLFVRTDEQRKFMAGRSDVCRRGELAACDALRSACAKRSGEACAALGSAYLAAGPRHDAMEALRAFEDGCSHHHVESCDLGGKLALAGTELPRDEARARKLLDHACELGKKDDCAAR
ncbi:MAG TPA: hypothetical protein VHE30_23930 [Polyangiaceae bacterium]|nr:hypothetical protein [Polyangiaceae bacterium]